MYITGYNVFLGRIRRARLPSTGLGWLFFLLALGIFIAASSNALLEKVFQDETLKRVLKVILYVVAFVFIILSVNADSKAGY